MSAADFWALTLREFDDMLVDYNLKVRRERDIPAALICSVIANANRNPEQQPEPWTFEDFLFRTEDELAELPTSEERAAADEARELAKMEHQVLWMTELYAGPGPLARKEKG